MNKSRITFRKILIWAAAGFGGALAGQALSTLLISEFAGSPAWELPAIVVGAIAAMTITFLVIPPFLHSRQHARDEK